MNRGSQVFVSAPGARAGQCGYLQEDATGAGLIDVLFPDGEIEKIDAARLALANKAQAEAALLPPK